MGRAGDVCGSEQWHHHHHHNQQQQQGNLTRRTGLIISHSINHSMIKFPLDSQSKRINNICQFFIRIHYQANILDLLAGGPNLWLLGSETVIITGQTAWPWLNCLPGVSQLESKVKVCRSKPLLLSEQLLTKDSVSFATAAVRTAFDQRQCQFCHCCCQNSLWLKTDSGP